jgi:hypothetical protein
LRTIGPPASDTIRCRSYCELQSASDAGFPAGRKHYWKSSYIKDLSDGAIDVILRFLSANPTPEYTGVGLQQMHGLASRVDPGATAFPHRDRHYDFLILSQTPDPARVEHNVAWTRAFFDAMRPFLEQGVYANNLGDEGEDRVRAAYGPNYDRLAAVKRTYDPKNVFSLNHNILPASPGATS